MVGSYSLNCANIPLLLAFRSRPPFSLREGCPGGAHESERACLQGMSEDKKPFTVSDRRHFTPEGEVRKSDAEETAPRPPTPASGEAAPAAAPAPAAASPPEVAGGVEARAPSVIVDPSSEAAAPAEDMDDAAGPAGGFPSDFLGLLISLGAQASMLLMGGPEGERPDLESSRSLIELLGSLKEKTEGRRTPQEDQLLDGLLYELRMAYVQVTKAAGR
jgi:Domain of unknown function (DUF1844)